MKKVSLNEKIKSKNTAINELFPIFKMPISHFYFGVAQITNRRYFDWFYKSEIEKYEELDLVNMVNCANEMIKLEEDKEEAEMGYQLMFQLIIEPFYELIQEKGEEKNEFTNDYERNM